MFPALRAMARDPEGKVLLSAAIGAIVLGTVVYPILEGWTLLDSLYFSVVTLATVGFGDLHPTTDLAKLFTVIYIIYGIGILAAFASTLVRYVEYRPARRAMAAASPLLMASRAAAQTPTDAEGIEDHPAE